MPHRIVFPERGRAILQEFDLPEMADDSVRVRTIHSLMSIGTETSILNQKYDPGTHYDRIFGFPQLKTGVQALARVEAVGASVRDFKAKATVSTCGWPTARTRSCRKRCSPPFRTPWIRQGCVLVRSRQDRLPRRPGRAIRSRPAGADHRGGAGRPDGGALGEQREPVIAFAVSDLSARAPRVMPMRGGATHTLCGDIAGQLDEIGTMNGGAGPGHRGGSNRQPGRLSERAGCGGAVRQGDSSGRYRVSGPPASHLRRHDQGPDHSSDPRQPRPGRLDATQEWMNCSLLR